MLRAARRIWQALQESNLPIRTICARITDVIPDNLTPVFMSGTTCISQRNAPLGLPPLRSDWP
jgi:hypothetical protein